MAKLATERKFGKQRAMVNDPVVLMGKKHDGSAGGCIHAGVVVAVAGKADRPYIRDLRDDTIDFDGTGVPPWSFVETTTQEDVERLPVGSWTWPITRPA